MSVEPRYRRVYLYDADGNIIGSLNPLPVDVNSSALPTGAATAANQTNNSQKTQIVDAGGIPVEVDNSTHSIQIIDYEHHEIHSGSSYTADRQVNLANGASMDILLITPNTTKWAHLIYEIEAQAEMQFYIYEAPTATAGTAMTIINRNRNVTNPATVTLSHTPTGITTGTTIIRKHHMGAGKAFGGGARSAHEFVLKQNTKYLIRMTNLTVTTNWATIVLNWYEHTDKN